MAKKICEEDGDEDLGGGSDDSSDPDDTDIVDDTWE